MLENVYNDTEALSIHNKQTTEVSARTTGRPSASIHGQEASVRSVSGRVCTSIHWKEDNVGIETGRPSSTIPTKEATSTLDVVTDVRPSGGVGLTSDA